MVRFVSDRPLRRTTRLEASLRALRKQALLLAEADPQAFAEVRPQLVRATDPAQIAFLVAPHLTMSFEERVALLGGTDAAARTKQLLPVLARELELQRISLDIKAQVTTGLDESQRRTYLQEQVRVLRRELGEIDGEADELDVLDEDLERLELPEAVRDAVDRELARMAMMSPGSSEYMVSHSYLTWIKDLPWGHGELPEPPPMATARRLMAGAHYGLEPVKERILEYLAVMRHRGQSRGEILLLCGPPGVGKTSLARQVAAALGRPFVSVSLGGVKDEAEIRGHRRTYVGSLPGKLIQALKQVKSNAPVILLDEIDKVGLDQGRSSLSSALLEVLDFEQNRHFVDHYLGVPYDLSNVVFIATANSTAPIPRPLLDRLELVELSSYTEHEKIAIASRHLLPAIRKDLALTKAQLDPSARALTALVRQYTREAGVRQLKRELTALGRKAVKAMLEGRAPVRVTPESLPKLLGQPRFLEEPNDLRLAAGVAIGLAYTSVGGDILYIETNTTLGGDGKGARLSLTGSLGKVMRESAHAALSYLTALVHAKPDALAIPHERLMRSHIHLHLPDGATPKDGPSAGVAIMCAIASLLMGRPLSAKLAMTGEITLRGQVLAIGGLKEKLLAAHRYGKTTIIIPAANQHELAALPKEILRELEIHPVRTMEEALLHAGLLTRRPALVRSKPGRAARSEAPARGGLRIAGSSRRGGGERGVNDRGERSAKRGQVDGLR
jgi:ATP-dependent Lon protease